MVIDVDLNVGFLIFEEVKNCWVDVVVEVDFYGVMDGVLKFVKGDVIVGILIFVINVIGGILIGMF